MSDYFPEPIIEKILLRLPTKCLVKCTAVCKSWMSLIKSSTFIRLHLSRTLQDNDARLLLLNAFSSYPEMSSKSYALLWDDPVFGECKLINPITYNNGTIVYKGRNVSAQSLFVIGTCNGLVCLAPDSYVDSPVLIWNPSIRKIVILPSPPSSSQRYAFGYDSRTNDYKVLIIMIVWDDFTKTMETRGEIYSLARGTWKSLSAAATPVDFVPPGMHNIARALVNVNGSPHWSGGMYRPWGNRGNCIMSFDMVSEVFCKIEVPEALREQTCWVSKHGDCLALYMLDRLSPRPSFDFNIWVMKEYGVAESWTKLTLRQEGYLYMHELLYCRREDLVFERYNGNLHTVDCRTGRVKDYGIRAAYYFMDYFVESILLLGQANAISY
ncbi:F-box/kelch-repeat protein [Rosa sericea]